MSIPRTWHAPAEALLLPAGALVAALALFGVFVWFGGHSPVQAWVLLFQGAPPAARRSRFRSVCCVTALLRKLVR